MRWTILLLVFAGTTAALADILHLRDGSRHYGELISQSQNTVVFRVVLPGRGASVVRTFTAHNVVRVQRTGRRDQPPAVQQQAQRSGTTVTRDYHQMVREGFELLDDGRPAAAVRAMQRGVAGACDETLGTLDAKCRRRYGTPLDQLLAETRLRVACQAGYGRGFDLSRPTRYERAALGRRLAALSRILLQRTHAGRTVEQWAHAHEEYTELKPDARRMAANVTRAAALLAARLRYDPALKDDRDQRVRLSALHRDLTSLAAQILSMPGYLDLSPQDGWVDPLDVAAGRQPTTQPADEAADPHQQDRASAAAPEQEG